jgi:hypothetical protein
MASAAATWSAAAAIAAAATAAAAAWGSLAGLQLRLARQGLMVLGSAAECALPQLPLAQGEQAVWVLTRRFWQSVPSSNTETRSASACSGVILTLTLFSGLT